MKSCGKCQETKPLDSFSKRTYKSGNVGYQSWCRDCSTKNSVSWARDKCATSPEWLEKSRAYQRTRWSTNQNFRETQKSKNKQRSKTHYQNNKEAYTRKWLRRELNLKQATPSWTSEIDKERIKIIYTVRDLLSEKTGELWHVDHIVPLQGKNVCGLHLPSNLRIVTAKENLAKGNKYEQWF